MVEIFFFSWLNRCLKYMLGTMTLCSMSITRVLMNFRWSMFCRAISRLFRL